MGLLLINHCKELVTLDPKHGGTLGAIKDGALLCKDGRIAWAGPSKALPKKLLDGERLEAIDARNCVVMPGLIDCHTHLLFAGSREQEFAQRLAGKSYQEIAAAGGGILSTVAATRNTSRDELKALARRRLMRLLAFGVTTVEIKSGYGLSVEDEIKSLELIQELARESQLDCVPTFLGAHEVPAEHKKTRGRYIDILLNEMIPEVGKRKLARFCDVFCEKGVFSVEESKRILERGLEFGMRPKIHAEELSYLGGAEMAAKLKAVSADHLLHLSDAGIEKMKEAGTAAVLLPGTSLFLRTDRRAPARRLIDAGVPVAIATDCNPGSCMSENLPLMGSLACLQLGMSPEEVIAGMTLNAAKALDLAATHGSLEAGKAADLLLLKIPSHLYFPYHFGVSHVDRVIKDGHIVHSNGSDTRP